jgi:ABC-type siderophore export system fused ATPase/permease subunit
MILLLSNLGTGELFILVIILFIVITAFTLSKKRNSEANKLYEEQSQRLQKTYQNALQNGNKKLALEAGRNYFAHLRKGKLTLEDEQTITNDLSTI